MRTVLAILILVASACTATNDEGSIPATSADTTVPTPADTTPTTGPTIAPGDVEFTVSHDGRDRSYILHVPADVVVPSPVVIALHGGGGTGAGFQDDNGLDAVADREGFLAVYPEGSGILPNRLHTWNSGFSCCGYALDNDIDDVGFLRAVVEDLAARTAIDQGRVYATGHSNGGMMAYRFAVEAADVVTAIVPVGGALSVMDPAPSAPVAMLHIHSADDPRALYEGGQGPPFPGTSRSHVAEPVMPGIETWAELNGCVSGPTVQEELAGTGDDAGQRAERLVWECPEGADVEHLRLYGSGHGWPGVEIGGFWQRQIGPPTTLVSASEEVWAFVSRFSR